MRRDPLDKAVKKIVKDLRTGLYSLVVLGTLEERGPLHGYALLQELRSLEPVLAPSEGTLYESLKTLERLGLVEGFWAEGPRPRKYYRLTPLGREALARVRRVACRVGALMAERSCREGE